MKASAKGADAPPAAWQPLTFGGVAAFAGARVGRLLAAELAAAIMAAVCAVWFLHRAYCPVILQAIQKMPDTARVAQGKLQGVPDTLIAESKFLAIAAAPQSGGEIGQDADLQIELRQNDLCAGSVFWPDWGLDFPYRRDTVISLARSNLEPWWSAWQPVLLTAAGAVTVLFLLLAWAVLASAALLPGAVVLTAAMILYGWSVIDLVGLSFFVAIHIILGWIYVVGGSCKATPLFPANSNRNPFTA
jgi:hypothetical protein